MAKRQAGGGAGSLLQRVTSSGDPPARELRSEQELHILRRGMECFATTGYTATTVRDIAAAAGVTGAMINYYFVTKEALYTEIAELLFAALAERIDEAFDTPAESWSERLRNVCHAYVDFVSESRPASQFLVDALYGTRGGRPAIDPRRHDRIEARLRKLFADAVGEGSLELREGYTASDGAELVFMAVQFTGLRWLSEETDSGEPARARLRVRLDHLVGAVLVGFDAKNRKKIAPKTKKRGDSAR